MKKITSLVCMLVLLLTVVTVPSALAMETDYSGDWVCTSVDLGDGVLQTEYEGQSLQEVITFTLRTDGTVLFKSFGTEVEGVWAPTGGGVSVIADNMAIPFTYENDQLMNTEDGVTMYFIRAEDATKTGGLSSLLSLGKGDENNAFSFAGIWDAVSYIAMGIESDIALFFPDGFTLTLLEDGTGTVQLTADYAESIVWEETDGGIALSESNFLYDPVWDPQAGILTFSYASDVIQITFEKADAGAAEETGNATAANDKTLAAALPQEYTCAYFSMAFPEGWVQDEYNTYNWDTYYYSAQYNLEDKDGWTLSTVRVTASEEAVAGYRDKLDTLLAYASEQGKDALDYYDHRRHFVPGLHLYRLQHVHQLYGAHPRSVSHARRGNLRSRLDQRRFAKHSRTRSSLRIPFPLRPWRIRRCRRTERRISLPPRPSAWAAMT